MMSTNRWFKRAALAGALCGCGLAFTERARAADSTVPSSWNVAPMTNGAYREAFETNLPGWAGRSGGSALSTLTYSEAGLPSRSNQWFAAHTKVLQLDTAGTVLTNSVAYPGAEGEVSFATRAVYVDLRVRFDATTEAPTDDALSGAKMAVFVTANSNLVAVNEGAWTTNTAVQIDTNAWYQLTIRITNDTFDVFLNDTQQVFAARPLKNIGVKTLKAASFYGTGLVDDLYVSHGNPAYAVAGPTGTIPTLPTGGNQPTDEEQTRINVWLDEQDLTSLSGMTQDQLNEAYLIDELAISGGVASPVAYTFGISSFDLAGPASLKVTLSLTTDKGAKTGTINGRVQLQGKTTIGGEWETLSGAITPSYADFADGKATYTFTIPEGGYQFFRPLILP